MWRLTPAVLMLAVLAGLAAPATPADDPDLVAGIGLVKDGDFEAAVLRLDAAVRRLEAAKGPPAALARAYLYLGVSYLELDQEPTARGKFREAVRQDPALRLDPHQFSAQVIRVFEAARLEAGPAPGPASQAAASPSAPATTLPERKKKRSATPLLLIAGGGAAAAGIALAASGGGGAGTTIGTTTTLAATTTSTTTTTTTTTTTLPPGCNYTITPTRVDFSRNGGIATCEVRTGSACSWTAESTQDWLHVLGTGAGRGNGTIRFQAEPNQDKHARNGKIRLRERKSVSCLVEQSDEDFTAGEATLNLASELSLRGGSGQLVVNGASASFQDTGRRELTARARRGENRVEAIVVTAAGAPGTWRFDFAGPVEGAGLRILAGETVQITPSSVVFRLQGRAGERLVLLWGTRP